MGGRGGGTADLCDLSVPPAACHCPGRGGAAQFFNLIQPSPRERERETARGNNRDSVETIHQSQGGNGSDVWFHALRDAVIPHVQ